MPEVLRTAGRYELLRQVGHGGMAVVYLARQTDLDRFVALKELRLITSPDESMAQRFLREARTAGLLSHPNIVTVHEHFEFEGTPYIAMEYFERGSLRPYVGRMTTPQVIGVLEGLLAGLDHATHHGVIHRDLKPENVMATREGRVKIADFGIAKARNDLSAGRFVTVTGTTVGTPTYMAPEQAMAKDLGPYTDLYSVGVMAYEMLTGKVPFHDTDTPVAILLRHINDEIPPAREANPAVDGQLSDWVQRLLVKDWRERTPTAGQAWDELEDIVIGLFGSRWRRDARLPEIVPVGGTDRPLTPADFKATGSDLLPGPPPGGAPATGEVSDEFQSFHWNGNGGGLPAPTAPAEATPVPESTPEATPTPVSEPVSEPTPTPVSEATPVPVSEATPVPVSEATPVSEPAPVSSSEVAAAASGFVTFSEQVAPSTAEQSEPELEPEASPAPEPEPAPEPVAQTAPEPAAPSRSDLHAATIAPAAIPAPGRREPELRAQPAPRSEPALRSEPAPRAERESRREGSGAGAARLRVGLLVVGALIAALAGFTLGGGEEPQVQASPDQPAETFESGAVELQVPSGWGPVVDPPQIATTLGLQEPVAPAPGGRADDGIVAGRLAGPVNGWLVPAGVLEGEIPDAERLQLSDDVQAVRFDGVRIKDQPAPVTLFSIATTDGAYALACLGKTAGTAACNAIATTFAAKAGEPTSTGPQQPVADDLAAAMAALRRNTSGPAKQLRTAKTRSGQSSAARRLGAAYRTAGSALGGIDGVVVSEVEIDNLSRALGRTASAYSALGQAAGRGDRAAYVKAAAQVRAAGKQVAADGKLLTSAGYLVTQAGR